jgi:putative membrane protein
MGTGADPMNPIQPAPESGDSGPGASPNRTRDHLANERTFLAWVRTALALIGLGFVLARMGLFLRQIAAVAPAALGASRGHPGHEFVVTGIVFLALGTALAAWAGLHYGRSLRAIDGGRFEPDTRVIWILTALVVLGGLVIVVLVLWRVGLPEDAGAPASVPPRHLDLNDRAAGRPA